MVFPCVSQTLSVKMVTEKREGGIGPPIVSFPFIPSLHISKLKGESVGRLHADQEVKEKRGRVFTLSVRTKHVRMHGLQNICAISVILPRLLHLHLKRRLPNVRGNSKVRANNLKF